MSMEVRPFADLCPQANTFFLPFVSKHSIRQQRQVEDKCGVRYSVLHRYVVSVYSSSVCTVCGPAHVVDAIGLLFNVLAFTYSPATFVSIGRWSTHLVCTLDGWSPCLLLLLPAHERGDPFSTHLTRAAHCSCFKEVCKWQISSR